MAVGEGKLLSLVELVHSHVLQMHFLQSLEARDQLGFLGLEFGKDLDQLLVILDEDVDLFLILLQPRLGLEVLFDDDG